MGQVLKMPSAKSGLKKLEQNEILFNDGETANSLFIIQKGQLRLFKPKGKGFVEIAVLRAGEVIGEMAYFDEDGGRKRSCSASAIVTSEVIEVSFTAFSKTMSGLNPWFKTIINTLAKRLRSTNARVRELENNSASVNYSTGKHSGYEFLRVVDIIKILGTMYLVFKSHGAEHPEGLSVNRKALELYSHDIYTIMEAKQEEIFMALQELDWFDIEKDKDGLPNVLVLKNIELIRSVFIFYNTEKQKAEDKKMKISVKCQTFLDRIKDAFNQELEKSENGLDLVPISKMLEDWKQRKDGITVETLEEARQHGLVSEVIVDKENNLSVEVNKKAILRSLPHIKFYNKIIAINEKKSG